MKMYDVISLGELLIDFTENGRSAQGNPVFEANPGGAPCNVLAMMANLGHHTAFVGKVGEDFFGQQLENALQECNIEVDFLKKTKEAPTTLAFVHNRADGEREFSFYREPGADMLLTPDDIPGEVLCNTKIFHFGSLSMTHESARNATKKAIRIAKEAGILISFDPNLRPLLWNTLAEAKEQILYGISQCDVLKISDNEIQWLTGEEDYSEGVKWILKRYPVPLVLVSMGREGNRAYYKDMMVEKPAFLQKNTVDATGAGDTFMGCALHMVLKHGLNFLDKKKLEELLEFANAAAACVTTRRGALKVMPKVNEIERIRSSR